MSFNTSSDGPATKVGQTRGFNLTAVLILRDRCSGRAPGAPAPVLGQAQPGGGGAFLTRSLSDAVDHAIEQWPTVDRVFATCSYLLNQLSLTDEDIQSIAEQFGRLVRAKGLTWLIVSDAYGWRARPTIIKVTDYLKAAGFRILADDEESDTPCAFPTSQA